MDDLFSVAVPDEQLEARPAFVPLSTGVYVSTLQPGTELVGNNSGWEAVRLPFSGFRDVKNGKERTLDLHAQYTVKHATSAEAVRIGHEGLIGAAAAFGLTEQVTGTDGRTAQKLTASDMDELIDQFGQIAGTEVEVYIKTGKRMRDGQVQLKDDGTPWIDSEIKRISALKKTA